MLTEQETLSPDFATEPPANVFPALADLYQERGFEFGYSRGVNDVLLSFFEVTEQFIQTRPTDAPETRRLLHEFSRLLENHVTQSRRSPAKYVYFENGSGI